MSDDQHDELLTRLRAADPAASLPAADPIRVDRLLEDVMSTELTEETRETGTRGRSPLTWLVAAAALVVIAGIGIFALVGHDDTPDAPPTAADAQTVTELGVPGEEAFSARCAAPTSELIAGNDVAFDGTVTTVDDGMVTLQVTHWYAGEETDLVRIQAPSEELARLVLSVDFREGQRYLVAARDGQVAICGQSAPYSAELAQLYEQAF